ncbi:MAG: LysE family translocator [Minwuia sp.]|nr:LysE family translocator [Minwuia sp.]
MKLRTVGLGQGMRASILAAVGCTLGIVPPMLASIAGLAALLHTSALAFEFVRYLGVAWLLYMAWSVARDGGPMDVTPETGSVAARRIVVRGFLINILNPKLSLFFMAFLPQFVPAETVARSGHLLGPGLAFMAMTFVVFVGYGLCAALARDHVISRPRVMLWLRRSFAGAFRLLGLRLALADR